MRTILGLTAIVFVAYGSASPQTTSQETSAAPPVAAPITQATPESLETSRRTAIVTAAERVAPATVSVNVTRRQRRRANDLWGFFLLPREYEQLVQGLGSGFIISEDGLVITNQHVTEGAEEIIVTTRDGVDYEARLLGEDPLSDISVLKIDGDDLPVAPLGTSGDLMISEWVIAIGNPYNYLLGNSEPTVTAGVVSGVGRNLPVAITDLPSWRAEVISVLGAIQLITVTDAIQQERRLRSNVGTLIYEISDQAQRSTRLRPGDVIYRINRTPVGTVEYVQDMFRNIAGQGAVRVYYYRGTGLGSTDFYVRTR